MYTDHFGLASQPFGLTPDPSFLYPSAGHREALAALHVGLFERRGLIVMVGEVGTGKTTMLYSLLSTTNPDLKAAYISNTKLTFEELLKQALADFGLPAEEASREGMLRSFTKFLMQCAEEKQVAALVIDEAQNLDDDCIENLRLLSNVETFTHKLLQIVLVGQPELIAKLSSPHLRQMRERIAVYCEIEPLSWRDSYAYVVHRLQQAGGSVELFSTPALALLLWKAGGIPRRINIFCHNALLFAYGRDARRVTSGAARRALRARLTRSRVPWRARLARRWRQEAPPAIRPHERGLSPRRAAARPLVAAAAGTRPLVLSTYLIAIGGLVGLAWWNAAPEVTQPQRADAAPVGTDSVFVASNASAAGHEHQIEAPPELPIAAAASASVGDAVDSAPVDLAPVDPATMDQQLVDPPHVEPPAEEPAIDQPAASVKGLAADAPAPMSSKMNRLQIVSARAGSSIWELTRETYGYADPELVAGVVAMNPRISDPNHIDVGDIVMFPPLAVMRQPEE